MAEKKRVLILCTGNSARSQIAEGLLRHDSGDAFEVFSAGVKSSFVRPEAIQAMSEVGFVDITNPASPVEAEALDVGGDPTAVATTPNGRWALVVVNASPDKLVVIDLSDRTVETTIDLGGQPDSIAVSRDGRYAAIAIENERDEDVDEGRMPQAPAGFLTIVDLKGSPAQWKTRDVSLTGLAQRFPEDPEPEFVDINSSSPSRRANRCASSPHFRSERITTSKASPFAPKADGGS